MTNISNTFDNLSGLSDVKNFDQSQERELGLLEVPQAYQEFDEIENEINNGEHSLSEISTFAERLTDAQVVRRDDVLALESLVGELESLPHINSYTQDYSLVNYQITQESAISTVAKFVAKIAKQIWEFIMKTFEFIKDYIMGLFRKKSYTTDKPKQNTVMKQITVVDELVKNSQEKVKAKVKTFDNTQVATRNVRINKELRKLLYPRFNELTVLSRGGSINAELLIDEMCEHRMMPFYSTFLSGVYDRDLTLKSIVTLYVRSINTNLDILSTSTAEKFTSDLTVAPDNPYTRLFTISPEQVNEYVRKYGVVEQRADRIRNPDDQFKVMASDAYITTRDIVSIATTHPLPTPRVLLQLDFSWLGNLFDDITANLSSDMKMSYDTVKRSYRHLQSDFDNIHPDAKRDVDAIYSDWIVMNKMILTLAMFRSRVDSIWSNADNLTQLAKQVVDIIDS